MSNARFGLTGEAMDPAGAISGWDMRGRWSEARFSMFLLSLHTHLLMYSPVRTMLQVWHRKQLTCHCFSSARRDWPCLISSPHPAQSGKEQWIKKRKKTLWDVRMERKEEMCWRERQRGVIVRSFTPFVLCSVVFYPCGMAVSLINSFTNVGYWRAVRHGLLAVSTVKHDWTQTGSKL